MAVSGGFAWTFNNPLWQAQYPWTFHGRRRRRFAGTMTSPIRPSIANEAEIDRVFWTRGAIVLPVAETWALVPQVEYRDQQSNYDIYAFTDLTALLGVQKRF